MASVHDLLCPGCGKVVGRYEIHSDRPINSVEREMLWCAPCAETHPQAKPIPLEGTRDLRKTAALAVIEDLKNGKISQRDAIEILALMMASGSG